MAAAARAGGAATGQAEAAGGGETEGRAGTPLLVILGPTAVGKTALALRLARRLEGEIVSADSAMIYRGMDIGTDKPSPAERAEIPHHLMDVCDPDQPFSVWEYQRRARAAIAAVAARGRLPLLVGGTGLYIRAVIRPWYAFAPAPPDPALRAELAARAAAAGGAALHRELAAVDPEAAARIGPHNVRRLVRALEVYRVTGVPFSRWLERARAAAAPPYDALLVGLTRAREDLYRRIEARVEDQLRRGLVAEVRSLLAHGYSPALPALQALGYKEVIAYLEGRVPYEEMVRLLKRNTRRYAKRQETWFRREEGVRWFDLTRESAEAVEEAVVALVRARGWGRD